MNNENSHTTALQEASRAVTAAQQALTNLVLELRALPEADRPSWTAIGKALGITSSSAFSRFGVGSAASLEEAQKKRRERSREARARSEAFQTERSNADLGLSAKAAGKLLGCDARTVSRQGKAVRGRVQMRLVKMPSGRFAERYFLTS